MKKLDRFRKNDRINEEIMKAETCLGSLTPGTDEYKVTMDDIQTLISIQNSKSSDRVSNDTIAIIAANLIGIMLVLNHERLDVISSKAMSMIMKSRV